MDSDDNVDDVDENDDVDVDVLDMYEIRIVWP